MRPIGGGQNPPWRGKRLDLAPRDEGATMPQTEHRAPNSAAKPDYLTDEEWAGLTLPILHGVAEGLERTQFAGRWASDLGVAAVRAVLERLDELVAQERSDG
jgi:hypothetical protein